MTADECLLALRDGDFNGVIDGWDERAIPSHKFVSFVLIFSRFHDVDADTRERMYQLARIEIQPLWG